MTALGDCAGCRLTLAEACAGINTPRLCGLCELLTAEQVRHYALRWRLECADETAEAAE